MQKKGKILFLILGSVLILSIGFLLLFGEKIETSPSMNWGFGFSSEEISHETGADTGMIIGEKTNANIFTDVKLNPFEENE